MRTFLRYFLPPIAPILPFIALALWVIIDEAGSPGQRINGHYDDAPIRAAGIFLVLGPFIYTGLLLVQFLCLRFRRASFFTSYFIAIIVCALIMGFRNIYLGHWVELCWCAAVCSGIILPMAICSWLIVRWTTKPDA